MLILNRKAAAVEKQKELQNVVGRSDGFGMMFANYLYHAASARVRGHDLAGICVPVYGSVLLLAERAG